MKRTLTTFILPLVTLANLAVGASGVHAEEPIASSWGSQGYRDGFTFGLGVGGGNLSCSGDGCDDFTEAGSFDLHVGGMVAPDLALLADAWWMLHREDRIAVVADHSDGRRAVAVEAGRRCAGGMASASGASIEWRIP